MKCESLADRIPDLAAGTMSGDERRDVMQHVDSCPDCRAALRGAEALRQLRRRETSPPANELFRHTIAAATGRSARRASRQPFWLGTAFGGAVAASVFAIALYFGWGDRHPAPVNPAAEFRVAVGETRQMNLAFETDRQLDGARISILLSGDIEIPGYGSQRELSWTENLDAGTNRLALPVVANAIGGGQMIVKMSHPLSERTFVINLPADS